MRLMPNPRPFDGYVEQPVRVSATALIHFQRNRYSVPTDYAHRVVSLRIYPAELVVVAELALESGRPSGEHVLNVLARLKDANTPIPEIPVPLTLAEEPAANVDRYDGLRQQSEAEADHVR